MSESENVGHEPGALEQDSPYEYKKRIDSLPNSNKIPPSVRRVVQNILRRVWPAGEKYKYILGLIANTYFCQAIAQKLVNFSLPTGGFAFDLHRERLVATLRFH